VLYASIYSACRAGRLLQSGSNATVG
jgi:hypothetical protein